MKYDLASQVRAEFDDGLAALHRQDRGLAGLCFWRALNRSGILLDPLERRQFLGEFAAIFDRAGFEDLALIAIQDAIDLGQRWGDWTELVSDLLVYANVHARLGNLHEADAMYRSLIARCLDQNDFAHAASASTNLASQLVQNDGMDEAIGLYEKSLEYLQITPFPDTEIRTRLMFLQALDLRGADPDRIFTVARGVFKESLAADLTPEYLDALARILKGPIQRYLDAHPDVHAAQWLEQNFPALPLDPL